MREERKVKAVQKKDQQFPARLTKKWRAIGERTNNDNGSGLQLAVLVEILVKLNSQKFLLHDEFL